MVVLRCGCYASERCRNSEGGRDSSSGRLECGQGSLFDVRITYCWLVAVRLTIEGSVVVVFVEVMVLMTVVVAVFGYPR